MEEQKNKATKWVNSVTNFTQMRFSPSFVFDEQEANKRTPFVTKIKNSLPWAVKRSSSQNVDSGLVVNPSVILHHNSNQIRQTENSAKKSKLHKLQYCQKLTMEHLLIGNKNQLDLIGINQASQNFLDSDYLWSLKMENQIDLLAIQMRKCLIVLANRNSKKLYIYRFLHKNIKLKPNLIYHETLSKTPYSLCFFKNQLAIIYSDSIQIKKISNDNEIVKMISANYNFPENKIFKFFRAPQPIDKSLNLFFSEEGDSSRNTFTLWLIEVEYNGSNINLKPLQKIYDIKKSLKKQLVLKNFQKQTFLMNLGSQILAFKKGYMIDSVNINLQVENSILKYIGHQRLIHISNKRIQIYQFKLNTSSKPYNIKIRPLDSISMRVPSGTEFFKVVEVFNHNLVISFQVNPKLNKKARGQINYWIALTQPISFEQKIDVLFPKRKFASMARQQLEDHCDMARKMGMTNQQIFLELWKRSRKNQQDYQLLINTHDYNSIRQQICKILKKKSLSFSELYKLQRNSLVMLREKVKSQCTPSIFYGYISSAFLKKKLEYYRDINIMQRKDGDNEILMVSIKNLHEITNMHLENSFLQLVKQLCIEMKPVQGKIRHFLTLFKFPLRMVYQDLLTQIIDTLQEKYIVLLQKIPQILPYQLTEEEKKLQMQTIPGFYSGIWGQIRQDDEEDTLSFAKASSNDNKQIIKTAMKDLWFKRSFLTTHSFIAQTDQKISENFNFISSEHIFYFVIQKILESGISYDARNKIFDFIEQKYKDKLPHLKNKINLRYLIYSHLSKENILPKYNEQEPFKFNQFLCLQEYQFFEYLFKIEKFRKGFLLYEIKPMYEDNSEKGQNMFNESLLSYFKNPVSQLSDIKYLLNRINNEKKQFHSTNQDMYRILVKAMTYKLVIGSGNDIPLQQVLIYIENVPMDQSHETLSKLRIIHKLHEKIETLSKASINMSVKEIIENPQVMMRKIIKYMLAKQQINKDTDNILEVSYNILANLQFLHNTIYKQDEQPPFYIFFIFLTEFCEIPNMISHAKNLIADQFLLKEFNYDESISQILVIYLYKLKVSQYPKIAQNQSYLRSILSLLPENNQIREFIICEFEFSKMLSSQKYKVQYPLGIKHNTPGLIELQLILYSLQADHILGIDIDKLFWLMKRLQQLNEGINQKSQILENQEKSVFYQSLIQDKNGPPIKKKQVYEQFIIRLLSLKKLREVIPYIDKYLSEEPQESDIVYPLVFLSQINEQLNIESKKQFFKAAAFCFKKPKQLFQIVKQFILTPMSIKERRQLLKEQVQKSQLAYKGFNLQNKMLNQHLIKIAIQDGLQNKLFNYFYESYVHLVNSRSDFNQIAYSFIFIILLNSPYILAKFMMCTKRFLKIKNFRLILTYVTKQGCFDSLASLQMGHRLFLIVMLMMKQQEELEVICTRYFNYPLNQQLPDNIIKTEVTNFEYFNRLINSSIAFKKERKSEIEKLKIMQTNADAYANQKDEQQQKKKLLDPELIQRDEPISDSDFNSESEPSVMPDPIYEKKAFNIEQEMKRVIKMRKRKKQNINREYQASNAFNNIPNISQSINLSNNPEYEEENRYKSQQSINQNLEGYQNQMEQNDENEQFIIRIIPKDSESNMEAQCKQYIQKIGEDYFKKSQILNPSLMEQRENVQYIIKNSPLSHKGSEEEISDPQYDSLKRSSKSQANIQFSQPEWADIVSQGQRQWVPKHPKISEENNKSSQNPKEVQMVKIKEKVEIPQKKKKEVHDYPWYEGLPAVEQLGKQIYRSNLLVMENKNKKIFKIQALSKYEKHPQIKKYLTDIINYIFYESTESTLSGVMSLIQFLIKTYKLPIETRNLQIWVRIEQLQTKYGIQFNTRQLFPINIVFETGATTQTMFKNIIEIISKILNDVSVFKIAKLIAMVFQEKQYEDQVIYRYFLKFLQNTSFQGQNNNLKYDNQKIETLVEKLPIPILTKRFREIYQSAKTEEKKNSLKNSIAEKIKKKGNKKQKQQLSVLFQEIYPSPETSSKN